LILLDFYLILLFIFQFNAFDCGKRNLLRIRLNPRNGGAELKRGAEKKGVSDFSLKLNEKLGLKLT